MTPSQKEIVNALQKVSRLPGTWDKRFIRDVGYAESLTLSQDEWIYRLLFKYRKQLPKTYAKYQNHPLCGRKANRENDNNRINARENDTSK